jgi:hypothetical protein
LTERTVLVRQDAAEGPSLLAIVQMKGSSVIRLADHASLAGLDPSRYRADGDSTQVN